MQRLRFVNSLGAEISFDSAPPYIFWDIDGIGIAPVFPIRTQAPGQNGYTLQTLLLDERTVTVHGHIHGNTVLDMYNIRRQLNIVLNPLLGLGTLYYENDSGAWQAAAFCKTESYPDKIANAQFLEIEFECPQPYWEDQTLTQIPLAYIDGGIQFPLITPNYFGTLGYQAFIDNDGDLPVPLQFYIQGGAVNPIVKNETTGEYIQLAKYLETWDQLYINTDINEQEVSLVTIDPMTNEPVKQNAYSYLTDGSTLFKLVPGVNRLTFTSDDENKKVSIEIVFRKRTAGV